MPREQSPTESNRRPWSPAEAAGFRFAVVYVALCVLLPAGAWKPLVLAVGNALGVDILYLPNGSGDTSYNYVLTLTQLVIAVATAAIWTGVDQKRESHPKLAEWMVVGLRYFLASVLFSYGVSKVMLLQFPEPTLHRLVQPLGQVSPMGLAWTFTGFSPAYQIFAGLLEVLAATLLLSRRTTTLGALLGLGVMGNVVMLNYCFDIPVKLFSTHLFVFLAALVALDARRLLAVLVLNRPTKAVEIRPHFASRRGRTMGYVAKGIAIVLLVVPPVWISVERRATYGPGRPRSPIYGIYEVAEMRVDGKLRPGLIEDDRRWRYLIFDSPHSMMVQTMDGAYDWYGLELDLPSGSMTVIEGRGDPLAHLRIDDSSAADPVRHAWTITRLEAGQLQLAGQLGSDSIEVRAVARELEFPLTSRGFHWVNEVPLNR